MKRVCLAMLTAEHKWDGFRVAPGANCCRMAFQTPMFAGPKVLRLSTQPQQECGV